MPRTKKTWWYHLWGFAEVADWYGWWPRFLWRGILRWCDRKAGFFKVLAPDHSCQQGPVAYVPRKKEEA